MADIVIAEAVRSAVGRALKGSLAHKRSDELAGEVIAALLARVPQVKPKDVEDVILGCARTQCCARRGLSRWSSARDKRADDQ
jgi:acetyl-CoA acyltransferase